MALRRILIADDDVDALRLVGLMLERKGYQIIAAASGRQALEKAIEAQPDLIILDVMMPDMDGYQVTAQLRRHPTTEGIPILMFTAKTAVNDKIAGFQAGADDYLTKPVHPGELASRVEALLQRKTRSRDVSISAGLERGNVVAFLPTKGGLGNSTLALNTAIELKRMHGDKKVVLVELMEGNGTLALQAGLTARPGLMHILGQPLSALTKQSLSEHMTRHSSGLHMLVSTSQPPGTGGQLTKEYTRTILGYLSGEYDYVLLDMPPSLQEPYSEGLRMAQTVLLTLEPSDIGMEIAKQTVQALDDMRIGSHKVRLVLIHRVPASGSLSRNMVEQALRREMVAGIPPAVDLAYQSAKAGKPMVLLQPRGLIAQQVRRVVQAIAEES